jgi:glycosyltransferase involved in cell wall biosynthesis
MSDTVGIVIPAYNPDVDTLITYIEVLQDSVADTVHVELDVPEDSTSRITAHADSVNTAPKRRGKGRAITEGFSAISTDILGFVDADASVPVSSVERIVVPIRDGTADLAIGSRRHPDAIIKTHQTILRRRMGDAFALLARRMLPTVVYDYQCGAKALSTNAWETLSPVIEESGFAWDLEVIAMAGAMDYRIEEVPITWDDAPTSTVEPLSTAATLMTALFTIRHRIETFDEKTHDLSHSRNRDRNAVESNVSGED